MLTASVMASPSTPAQKHDGDHPATVLHASRLLDVDAGSIVSPGELLIEGERIVAAGSSVQHPAGTEVIDLGDVTLMPGLIDAKVRRPDWIPTKTISILFQGGTKPSPELKGRAVRHRARPQ
jgi:hypothetical protein